MGTMLLTGRDGSSGVRAGHGPVLHADCAADEIVNRCTVLGPAGRAAGPRMRRIRPGGASRDHSP